MHYLTTHTSLSPIRRGFALGFVNYKKGALDSQPQVIKITSCLPMIGCSLRVLLVLLPLKSGHHDIAEILLKVALNTKNKIKSNQIIIVLCLCFVFLRLVYPMLPVSLDCVVFLFCFSSSCVSYFTIFSGLCCVLVLFFFVLCILFCHFLWIVLF